MSHPWPEELSLARDKKSLHILFDDGGSYTLSAEYLRTHSMSAEVKGHSKDQEVLVFGKQDITITDMDMIGNYAVKITFSDGHDTGLFTWQYLRELGENYEAYWQTYLNKLASAGRQR